MKRRYSSFSDQKNQRHKLRWIILSILIFFLFYTSITSLFFSMRVLDNDTMAPNLLNGDRFLFSSYSFYSLVPALSQDINIPRGSVVLVNIFKGEDPGIFLRVLDGTIRFFTAQQLSIIEQNENIYVKRLIGLPGDEISMVNFIIRVRERGGNFGFTEFEMSENDYILDIPQVPALWDASLPFSGNMDPVILGENEYFVISDDRSNTNDSRTWGPISISNISGRALFRYWPLSRVGIP